MSYEFSTIEREIHPFQISKIISEINELSPGSGKKRNQNEKITSGYQRKIPSTIAENYKKLFVQEFHRIKTSIHNHKIEDPEPVFTRYIATNYNGLQKLNNTISNKSGSLKSSFRKAGTLTQKVIKQIYYQLKKFLVRPLMDLMETDFKKELISSRLMDTPIETFLKTIKNNKVAIIKHSNYIAEEYKPIYSNHVNKIFTVEYNNHNVEALYNEHLESVYLEFQSYLEETLEKIPEYLNKVKLLNSLKERISSVNNFFFKDPDSSNFHPKRLMHFREDVCDNLKFKLHKYNILEDLDIFHQALIPLTEIQKIYINRSLKYVKSLLNLVNLCKEEIHGLDHQNQTPSNQLSLQFNGSSEPAEKLQWRGNINQLITFFYDATTQVLVDGEPILDATKRQIVLLLTQNFVQKDGDSINPATINTIFTPSKVLKRPPLNKRITIPTN